MERVYSCSDATVVFENSSTWSAYVSFLAVARRRPLLWFRLLGLLGLMLLLKLRRRLWLQIWLQLGL